MTTDSRTRLQAKPPPLVAPSVPATTDLRSDQGAAIEIAALRGSGDRRRFIDFPYRLHRGNPNWIPSLRRDIRTLLNRRRNPFFDHGEAEFLLPSRRGKPVGRISAHINRLHLE